MKRRVFVLSLAASALAVVGVATAGLRHHSDLDKVKRATVRFHDVDKAIDAGYSFRLPELAGGTCIAEPGQGAMGVHMVDTTKLDAKLVATEPEVLVYDPRVKRNGQERLRLVAVEYVIFQSAWTGSKPPRLFGQKFDFVPEPNRYGLPAFYALHAWIWKRNPSGLFFAWNPRVRC